MTVDLKVEPGKLYKASSLYGTIMFVHPDCSFVNVRPNSFLLCLGKIPNTNQKVFPIRGLNNKEWILEETKRKSFTFSCMEIWSFVKIMVYIGNVL